MRYQLKNPISISEVLENTNFKCTYSKDYEVKEICQTSEAREGSLSFCTSLNSDDFNPKALYIGNEKLALPNLLISENPRLDFIKILALLDLKIGFNHFDFETSIHPSVRLGENVVIERGVIIGNDTYIDHNVVVRSGSKIGSNCFIGASSSIGTEGFGYERDEQGVPIKFVHLGSVSIGDNVEIGSQTSIVRGTLSDTIIESNVKIDNLVHIAHNVHIKDGALVVACSEVSGSVVIGKNAWIAPNACIMEKVVIGDNAVVGLGAVVIRDVPDRTTVAGNPAKPLIKK